MKLMSASRRLFLLTLKFETLIIARPNLSWHSSYLESSSMTRYFSRLTARAAIVLALIALFYVGTSAQQQASLASINYRLTMQRPASHLFGVSIEVALPEGTS